MSRAWLKRTRTAAALTLATVVGLAPANSLDAQTPFEGEVRQLVTFRFQPGRSTEALELYREQALPLYERDPAMRSFRAFREVESPVPLDLVVVSSFDGMAGMDESNAALRGLAAEAGTSIGAIYGGIGALSELHHDQFVEMLPELGDGDPASSRLVAFIWYRMLPGEAASFERTLRRVLAPLERESGTPSSTGRFLVSDGWDYLRIVGFDSLAAYQEYWQAIAETDGLTYLEGITSARREVILAPMPELAVR